MTPPRSANLAKEWLAVQCATNQRAATPRMARLGSGSELAREQHQAQTISGRRVVELPAR
jgi:hypothetical protein